MNIKKIPIQCRIPVDLDKRFRLKIAEKYGVRRGALEKALTEAIMLWLKVQEEGERL